MQAESANRTHHPELNNGEIYAGIILGKDGAADHHLILLPNDAKNLSWAVAVAWAIEQGGELPDRRELALLYANLKEQLENDWYWSSEEHTSYSDCAWSQNFFSGNQYNRGKTIELRARAVRRLVI